MIGALTGLGGGVIIVPLLTLAFGVDIRYAIGASLISVIATSSGAASAYVKEGYSNIRIGMFLEIATTIGAIFGAYLAGITATNIIAIVFGIVLLFSAILTFLTRSQKNLSNKKDRIAEILKLNGNYPTKNGLQNYSVQNVPQGFGLMFIAGSLSGLLGIGSGAAKVLAMDQVMKIPFKVSTTTSNFMIGVTAAASAGIYLSRGYIDPGLSLPVVLGVLLGSLVGAKILTKAPTYWLKILFSIIIFVLAFEMIKNGFSGRI
jgi:uncharacterized membrane protein YfcA